MTTVLAPRPQTGTPRPYTFPTPVEHRFANGLRLEHFATADRLATIALVVAGGMRAEPLGREGVASIAIGLRGQGTQSSTAEEYALELDRIGATIHRSVTEGASTTVVRVPVSHLASALGLLADSVLTPAYPQAEFDRLRSEALQAARTRLTDPGQRAELELRRAIFAEGDRSAAPLAGSVESLTALTREDVVAFDAVNLTPQNATLILGGRIDADLAELVEAAGLGRWTGAPATAFPAPVPAPADRTIVLVDRPDAVQTEIRLGVVVPGADAEGHAALEIASQTLGGSMNSRLNASLREEKGYTYGIWSAVIRLPERARFLITTPVDTDSTVAAITELARIVDELRADGPTDAETERSRDELLLGAALRFQTAEEVVHERVEQVALGFGNGWFDAHRADLREVVAPAAEAAFAASVPHSRLSWVLVGDAAKIRAGVEDFFGADAVEVRAL